MCRRGHGFEYGAVAFSPLFGGASSFLMLCELALWGTLIRTPISFMLWEHGNLTTSQSYCFLIASGWHLTCEFGEHKLLDRAN